MGHLTPGRYSPAPPGTTQTGMSTAITTGAPTPPVPAGGAAPVAAAAPAAPGGSGALVTAQPLPVSPGQALAARVIAVQAGMVELALAGGIVTAASDLPLEPGQTLRLVVGEAGADRVMLRLQPEAGAGAGGASAGARPTAQGALVAAGVPAAAASALLAALADGGETMPSGSALTALAGRAAAAGVTTPATAAAFVRLEAAGLPATPAAVAGLARLVEGAPLGRAIATLLDGAAATAARAAAGAAGTPSPGAGAPGAAPGAAAAPPGSAATGAPSVTPPAPPPSHPAPFAGTSSRWSTWTTSAGPSGPSLGATPAAAPSAAAATPLPALVAALGDLAEAIGTGATMGGADHLRRAIAELGTGLEARLAAGDPPDAPPLRALLHALAGHPAADAALARAAAGLADGLAAQGLAGATIPPPGAVAPDPASPGAYLQLPLPGGGTAEVRVAPDGGDGPGGDGERPRRLAFLLHLSALGPVMIDATAGRGAVDATIRVGSDEARAFLATQAGELVEALRRAGPAATVSVERATGPAPERLLAPPPSPGLDLSA